MFVRTSTICEVDEVWYLVWPTKKARITQIKSSEWERQATQEQKHDDDDDYILLEIHEQIHRRRQIGPANERIVLSVTNGVCRPYTERKDHQKDSRR